MFTGVSLSLGTHLTGDDPVGIPGVSPFLLKLLEPAFKADRAESRVIAGGEALIVHRNAVVECLGIGDYRPCVPGCFQELPHEVVLPNRFGTGQLERAVQRLTRATSAMTAATSSAAMGCISTGGSRTVCPSVANWAMAPTNS